MDNEIFPELGSVTMAVVPNGLEDRAGLEEQAIQGGRVQFELAKLDCNMAKMAAGTRDMSDFVRAEDGDEEAARRFAENDRLGYLLDPRSKAHPETRYANVGYEVSARCGVEVYDLYQNLVIKKHLNEDVSGWTRNDFARRVGEEWVKDERGRIADEDAAWEEMRDLEDSVERGLPGFLAGFSVAQAGGPGEAGTEDGFTIPDEMVNTMRKLNPGFAAKAEHVRTAMQKYFGSIRAKDGKYEDVVAFHRRLDAFEDYLFEDIGDDETLAQLYYTGLMGLADRWAEARGAGGVDELVVALRGMARNWREFGEAGGGYDNQAALSYSMGAAPFSSRVRETQKDIMGRMEERRKLYESHAKQRAMLAAARDKAMEVKFARNPWEAVFREEMKLAGQTLPWMVPYVGAELGLMNTMVQGETHDVDAAMAAYNWEGNPQGYESEAALRTDVTVDAAINAWVELGAGRVFTKAFGMGAKGLSNIGEGGLFSSLGSVARAGQLKAGSLAQRFAVWGSKSYGHALAVQTGAAFFDEAILEPITQALFTYGADHLMDALGVEHGRTQAFVDCFDELKQIWTEPASAGAMFLFCAMVSGANYPGIRSQVKWLAENREKCRALGATAEQADRAMGIADRDERLDYLAKAVQERMQSDPEGFRRDVLECNRALAESGQVLAYTGTVEDAEMNPNGELGAAYQAAWREMSDLGLLPNVERTEDGKFHIYKKEWDYDVTVDGETADVVLKQMVDKAEGKYYQLMKKKLDVRRRIVTDAGLIAGEAAKRAVRENGEGEGVKAVDLTDLMPEGLAEKVRQKGRVDEEVMQDFLEYTRGLLEGVSGEADEAVVSRWKAAGIADSVGGLAEFAGQLLNMWGVRVGLAGVETGGAGTGAFRVRRMDGPVVVRGGEMLGTVMLTVPGGATSTNILEEVTESFLDQLVQEMVSRGGEGTPEERTAAAWREVADVVSKVREHVLAVDPRAEVEAVDGSPLSVIEAFSTLAMSDYLGGAHVPAWMRAIQSAARGLVTSATALEGVRAAMAVAREKAPDVFEKFTEMLEGVGERVQTVFERARVEEQDAQAWRAAVSAAELRAQGPGGVGGESVSRAVAEAREEEQAIREGERVQPVERTETAGEAAEHVRTVLETHAAGSAGDAGLPERVRKCFAGGHCVHNESGNYYMGLVSKTAIKEGDIEQVKVGAKGKHGVIAGRELTGDFEPTAAPLFLWLRKNGELQLISGRHRFAKLMEDGAVTDHPCYVFVEGESFAGVTFDERWARMMDFENNMRDDQADEVTAAIYARETGYSDEYMRKKGLLRNGSKAKRGIYIGRQAGDELFTRVRNGAVSPMDAEIICRLTAPIKDRTRVADIQVTCCTLLDQKKSWEYIGAMAQLLANKEAVTLKQGLLDLGADFEADMDRMAKFVERNLQSLAEAIGVLKGDRKLAKKGGKATRLGVSAQLSEEEREQRIADLERIKAEFELIGSNPELIAQAQLWDGKTELDPVARYLEQAQAAREQEARESGMDAGEYLEEQAAKRAAAEAVPSLFGGSMSLIMGERGAARLTEAVEVLGNLRTARGMLGRRKWHELTRQEQVKIKLATGWEQDAEGHWVMEAPDLNQVFPEPDVRFMDAAERAYQEHCEAAEEATRIWEGRKGKELTPAERKRYDEASMRRDDAWREYKKQHERYRKSGLPKGPLKMEDFIKGTPYEEAYPELKGIKVECRVLRGCTGYFSPLENAIYIDKDCVEPRVKLGIALHEVQHVIQDIEGWGKGGDASLLGKENYRRLTGEVAARNAERRTYMPVGERNLLGELGECQALLEDTEDVARENQLVRDSHNTLRGGLQAVGDLRMSFSGVSEDEVMRQWGAAVDDFIANPPVHNSKEWRKPRFACPTPSVLQMIAELKLGMKWNWQTLDVLISHHVFAKVMDEDIVLGNGRTIGDMYKAEEDQGKHKMSLEEMKKLPSAIANPICVYKSDPALHPNSVEIITSMTERGHNVLVAIKLAMSHKRSGRVQVNKITSLYGKFPINELVKHEMLYMDEERTREWMSSGMLDSQTADTLIAGYGNSVLTPADLVKYKNQRGMSFSTVEGPRNLAAVHTLSLEKLQAVKDLGGMPMPSVAVTRLDRPYTWGGEGAIALVGTPRLGQPGAGNRVWFHDAWSGTMPEISYRMKNYEKGRRFEAKWREAMLPYGLANGSLFRNGGNSGMIQESDVDAFTGDRWGAAWAVLVKGYKPEPAMQEAYNGYAETWKRFSDRTRERLTAWADGISPDEHITDATMREFCSIMREDVENNPNMLPGIRARRLQVYADRETYLDDPNNYRAISVADNWLQALHNGEHMNTGAVPDSATNSRMFAAYVQEHRAEFERWAEATRKQYVGEPMFQEHWERRNARGVVVEDGWEWKKATLTNLTRHMKQEKRRGNETSTLTPGLLLAYLSDEIKGKREMDWRRERVISTAEFKAKDKAYKELYSQFYEAAYEKRRAGSYASVLDVGDFALGEVVGLNEDGIPLTDENIREALKKDNSIEWNEEVLALGVQLVKTALEMPTDYMEAIPQRAVKLDEFRYAVMPEALRGNEDVRRVLEGTPIQAIYHDGTREGYEAAMRGLIGSGVAFSRQDAEVATERALRILEGRPEERYARELAGEFRKRVERFGLLALGEPGEGSRKGRGAKFYGELMGLVDSARLVLGEAAHVGRLSGLLAWCRVYAGMMQEGKAPDGGELKGGLYSEFVSRMKKMAEGGRLNGLKADEVEEMMAQYAGERLDVAMDKVLRHVVRSLDDFVKARARERMDYLRETCYPKREEGRKWPRGKMSADAYRRVERIYQMMEMDAERVATRIESVKRELAEVQGEDEQDEGQRAKEEELEDELALLSLYGDWEHKGAQEAARAAESFAQEVLYGRREWTERLRAERRRLAWQRQEIEGHFKTPESELLARSARRNAKEGASDVRIGMTTMGGFKSFAHLLKGLEKHFGQRWTIGMRHGLADIHVGIERFLGDLGTWLLTNVRDITGLQSEGDIQDWLTSCHEFYDTGITLEVDKPGSKLTLSPAEAYAWLRMTPEEREAKRAEMRRAAETMEELPDNIPTEEQLVEMRHKVGSSYVAKTKRGQEALAAAVREAREEKVKMALAERESDLGRMLTRDETQEVRRTAGQLSKEEWTEVRDRVIAELSLTEELEAEHVAAGAPQYWVLPAKEKAPRRLETTKMALLQAVLTFEQPDYERLMEPNGVTPAILWEMKKQIGPKLLELGYRMREKLNENGQDMAEVYERLTGIPFGARANYFRGIFDVNKAQQFGEAVDSEGGSGMPSGKHGMLIPRRYHKCRLPWESNLSALSVFLEAMKAQNRYTLTAEYLHDARGLMQDRDFMQKCRAEVGASTMSLVTDWLHLIEGSELANTRQVNFARKLIGKVTRGMAVSYLAGNVGTYIKQATAIVNSFLGGFIPEKVEVRDGRTRVLAERGIGVGEWLASAARVVAGRGKARGKELAGDDMFRYRAKADGADTMGAAQLPANRKVGTRVGRVGKKVADALMYPIYWLDIMFNRGGAAVLYDATYRALEAKDEQGLLTPEQKDRVCRDTIRQMLDYAAQPVLKTQMSFHAAARTASAVGEGLFLFRSESLKNIGAVMGLVQSGDWRRAAAGFLFLGVGYAAVLQLIDALKGYGPDDDDEDKWAKVATKFTLDALTGDLTSIPVVDSLVLEARGGVEAAIGAATGAKVGTPQWRSQGAIGTVKGAIKSEARNIDDGAPMRKHVAAVSRMLKGLGVMCSFCQNSAVGPVSDVASLAWALAACGNLGKWVEDIYETVAGEEGE